MNIKESEHGLKRKFEIGERVLFLQSVESFYRNEPYFALDHGYITGFYEESFYTIVGGVTDETFYDKRIVNIRYRIVNSYSIYSEPHLVIQQYCFRSKEDFLDSIPVRPH